MDFVRAHRGEYGVWLAMKQRCRNPNHPEYPRYGGRGITVCDRWADSFESFLADMGDRPEGFTLDRVDNEGNYEPENCEWALQNVQNRNYSRNNWLTYNGETLCITDWAKRIGVNHQTLRNRLKRGWTLDEALGTPRLDVGRDEATGRLTGRQ